MDKEKKCKELNCQESLTWNLGYLYNFDLYLILIRTRIEGLRHIFFSFCYIHTEIKNFLCIQTADVGSDGLFFHFSLIDSFEPHFIYLFNNRIIILYISQTLNNNFFIIADYLQLFKPIPVSLNYKTSLL